MMLDQGRFYLGHLGPIPLYVHWTFIFLLFLAFNWSVPTNGGSLIVGLLILMALLLGIVLHELGHGLAARAQGAYGTTITLWALGGLCSSTRDQNPRREIIILAAGPLVSLALWWGSHLALQALNAAPAGSLPEGVPFDLLVAFLVISKQLNMMLFIFNMLPIYPLDGGQIMYNLGLLATRRHDVVRKFTLACAVAGAVLYLGWHQHEFGTVGISSIILMGWLVFNAFTSLR